MDTQTIKHLELIQGVVNRLANNSFAFKAWAIVLVRRSSPSPPTMESRLSSPLP